MVEKKELMEVSIEPSEDATADIKLRPINCELNPLTRTDGSALFSQGETSVMASIVGPVEAKMQSMKIQNAIVECIYRPKAGIPNVNDKMQESIIRNTCESSLLTALHPRTMISIQIQELDDRCGLEACAINAACMALLIAGIPMRYTIAAVHCIVDKDGQLLLDPDYCQAIGNKASFIFVFDSLDKNLVTVHTNGNFDMGQYNDALLLSREASEIIFKFYRKIVAKSQNKTLLPSQDDAEVEQQPNKVEPMEA